MAIIDSFMPFSMPLVSAAMPTRLATPRMMPSIVSRERNLCAQISLKPTKMALRRFILIVAQRLNWMQARCFKRRNQASDDADQNAGAKREPHRGDRDDRRVVGGRKFGEALHENERCGQAGHPAEDRKHNAFDQDLREDIEGCRAD